MRALIQRVSSASVVVNKKLISEIDHGLLVLLGIKSDDTQKDRDYVIRKVLNMRIFSDDKDKMNNSVVDVGGSILLVSQFTLYGDCTKGNRPSFIESMAPDRAEAFYNDFLTILRGRYSKVKEGVFGAHMTVSLINDGPVTILIDS